MNRTIKFRAWNKKEKEMTVSTSHLESWFDGERYVLIQFTGLLDKNSVEIYEGDIVHVQSQYVTEEPIDCNAEVSFRDGSFRLNFHDMIINQKVCSGEGNWVLEVIGNKWESSHLNAEQPQ